MTALDTAIRLAQSGLSVIPIRADATKAPACETWKEFQTRIPSEAEIREMFRGHCGVGIVAGEVSGNLEVLDVESEAPFEDFRALVAELDSQLIDILPHVETPSGGHHLFYRCEEIAGNQKLAMTRGSDGKPDKVLFETRARGGYVVTINSPAECHEYRKEYRLVRGRLTQIPCITREQRSLLLDCARSFNQVWKEKREPKPAVSSNGTRPGDRFAARVSWPEILEPRGWVCIGRRGEELRWRRPGKNHGLSATTNHNGSDTFHVFSTNAPQPFESDANYTKFYAFALLEHGGDMTAAARVLAERFRMNDSIEVGTDTEPAPGDDEEAWPDALDPAARHGLAGEIVSSIEPNTESDPVAILIQTLVAFGNAAGRNAYFQVEADRHYMNLYTVLVGDTSKARKGTSKGQVMSLFRSVDKQWELERGQSGLSSGEGLIWAVRDPMHKKEPIKEKGRVIDYQSVMVDEGVEDKRLLVVETEFASTLRVQSRDANTLSPTLRNAWDSGHLRILTKNSPAVATNAHISVIGHITKDELVRYLDSTEAANGFANRFLWPCVRRSKLLPEGGRLQVEFSFISRLRAALDFARKMDRVQFDAEALESWWQVYPTLSQGQPGLLGAITARAETQVLRLALVYAMLDCSHTIQLPHLLAGLALWEYCEQSAAVIFGDRLGDPIADDILAALRRSSDGLTRTQISNLFHRNREGKQIGRALSVLLKAGRVRHQSVESDEGGRPPEVWMAVRYITKKTKDTKEVPDSS